MAARSILVPEAAPPAEGEAPTLWSLTWQHPIFRSLDPHFREDLFPPPKPQTHKAGTSVEQSGVQEKQPEDDKAVSRGQSDEASKERSAEASAAVATGVTHTGAETNPSGEPETSKEVADEGANPEDVDVAEGYEKVEKDMVEPVKTIPT